MTLLKVNQLTLGISATLNTINDNVILESNTRDRLSALQGRLNEVVDKLAIQLTDQFEPGVRSHARECGKLLQKVS
ncbi:unnamed protein product [Schistosoma mattheei]|uniref:Uncharacterized protein n=1 Tax=Schistosoma mattheei TaxID=31246 RepID=A0A183Q4U3_9TREM|nr:unnamed protein product [Schistosoma mattheei]